MVMYCFEFISSTPYYNPNDNDLYYPDNIFVCELGIVSKDYFLYNPTLNAEGVVCAGEVDYVEKYIFKVYSEFKEDFKILITKLKLKGVIKENIEVI